MAISSKLGFPDLFLTFTCNPTWPEITRLLSPKNLKAHDLPDIISKLFKIKFVELMNDITKQHVLGKLCIRLSFKQKKKIQAHIIHKNGIQLDNRITASVISSKGASSHDTYHVNEAKQYLYCRYVSPSEAYWRFFSYKIHGRKTVVKHMFFHLIGDKVVYYLDFDRMENVLEKENVTESMFTCWLVTNGKYEEAKELTYDQFATKFVYEKRKIIWKPQKRGFTSA
ncbi:uncharacterized protein LOC127095612 [Lathyrus oleraceus]|uniref:uncharacterized protein LOC127095612 n=1 Tax=Pisum sativum TaxID=3888 RepID=UPI0021CEA31A|nr:uncharacterized protein LOC127095612 [Pisum sativum]